MKASDLYNPLMRWLLRSPFHGLISGSILLISYTGRRSGRRYATPANYSLRGQTITILSSRAHSWWRNFAGGAGVVVRVRGRDHAGTAEIVPASPETVEEALLTMYPRMSPPQAARLAPDLAVICIQLACTGRPAEQPLEAAEHA